MKPDKMFYQLINKLSNADIMDGARDYRMMTRQMVNSILELNEYHRFSKGILNGWDIIPNDWSIRMLKELPEKPNGRFGNYLNMHRGDGGFYNSTIAICLFFWNIGFIDSFCNVNIRYLAAVTIW